MGNAAECHGYAKKEVQDDDDPHSHRHLIIHVTEEVKRPIKLQQQQQQQDKRKKKHAKEDWHRKQTKRDVATLLVARSFRVIIRPEMFFLHIQLFSIYGICIYIHA